MSYIAIWNFINGWNMNVIGVRANVCLLGLFLLCQYAVADDEQTEQASMELLEFLGNAEMIDGEWLDPLHMLDVEASDVQVKQQEEQEHE